MTYIPSGVTATEAVKYHIHPDVIAQYPAIETWAASHDDHVDMANAVESLIDDAAYSNVLDGVEQFMDGMPDGMQDIKIARKNTKTLRSQFATLSDFRDACIDKLESDTPEADREDRILDAIRLGEKLRQLRGLRAAINDADTEAQANSEEMCDARRDLAELADELGVTI